MNLKRLFDLCRKAVSAWVDDFAPSMGAAISYYTMFSLAPLLIIVIAVAGAIFGQEAVQGQIVSQLSDMVGRDGALAVQGLIKSASERERGIIASAISIVVLVIGATTVFAELQSALDRIWHVPERAKPSGIWSVLRARVLSFGLILGLAFLLMVSLVVSAAVSAFGGWAGGLMPGWEVLLQFLNIAVSISISTVLFAMIFKFMPTAQIGWHDVWVGAAVTAVLFELGKFLIGLYLGKSGVNESYAAAGSIVVLLAWVYYAAQIFLLGAEFTKVYANEHGSVAGQKAAAATKAQAAAMAHGTDDPRQTGHAGAHPSQQGSQGSHARPSAPAPAYAAAQVPENDDWRLGPQARQRLDLQRRLDAATRPMMRQVAILAVTTLASALLTQIDRRQKKQRRQDRARR